MACSTRGSRSSAALSYCSSALYRRSQLWTHGISCSTSSCSRWHRHASRRTMASINAGPRHSARAQADHGIT
eukprot:2060626-Pyramimonas_sp.AAC.1